MKTDTINKTAVLSVLLGCLASATLALLSHLPDRTHTVQMPEMPPGFSLVLDSCNKVRYREGGYVSYKSYESVAECANWAWSVHRHAEAAEKMAREVRPISPQ